MTKHHQSKNTSATLPRDNGVTLAATTHKISAFDYDQTAPGSYTIKADFERHDVGLDDGEMIAKTLQLGRL